MKEEDSAGGSDIEGINRFRDRNGDNPIDGIKHLLFDPMAFGTKDESKIIGRC